MLEKLKKLKQPRNSGEGNITPSGYIRIKVKGKLYMQHRYVWEQKFGKVPKGYDIHHRDGNKQNNELENLQMLARHEHKRKHADWYQSEGRWYKHCKYCGLNLEVSKDNFYLTTNKNKNTPEGTVLFGKCKSCHVKEVSLARKAKKIKSRPFAYST